MSQIVSERFTVVVPFDKNRGYLERCVKSIADQTYPDVEMVLSQSDRSVAYNFNRGLERATGEWIKFCAEDDWLPKTSCEDLARGIGDGMWGCANAFNIRGPNKIAYKPPTLDFAANLEVNRIHGGTTIYRTEVLREIGGMDESLWTGEEYDMHLRLFCRGFNPVYIDRFVYFHMIWAGQKSRIYRQENKAKRDEAIKKIQARYTNKV